jgi:hypothetical protein
LDIEVGRCRSSSRDSLTMDFVSQGLDALMSALQTWNGGVIIISHDERFITSVAKEVTTIRHARIIFINFYIHSSGCVEMGRLANSEGMFRVIR